MQPLKLPVSFALGRTLSFFSKIHVVTHPYTLRKHARCHSTEPPPFTRHHAAPRVSLSNGPPLSMFTPKRPERGPPEELSDLEWEIRTGRPNSLHVVGTRAQGRAIYILEKTLPEFFQVGLISNIDPTRPDIVDVPLSESGRVESIYSPTIRLTYTPPVALPPPFPRTLSLDGLALYMTSSVFIRHTMKTFYSDLRVEMRKLAVHTPPGATPSRRREKSVFVGVTVHGTTRVSGGQGEWQIDSTYEFSGVSGMINLHKIDSIQPAPHQAAYDALGRVFGMEGDIGLLKRESH